MAALPTGTVTFLFTDIEGSTRLATESAEQFPKILERHHALLRQAFGAHDGVEVITEGDGFFVVFSSPLALSARCRCPTSTWPTGRAPHHLREALAIFEQVGNGTGVAMITEITAAGAGFVGLHELSARLFGAAESLKDKLGGGAPSQLLQTAPFRASTVAALGKAEFQRYYAEGSALSSAEAADLARSFEAPAGSPPLPYPELWGVEAERRAAAAAAEPTPGTTPDTTPA